MAKIIDGKSISADIRKELKVQCECLKEKGIVPRMYQSCGTADFLYQMNVAANKKLTEMGAKITGRETPGIDHVWDFWDSEIRWILKNWLLVEE